MPRKKSPEAQKPIIEEEEMIMPNQTEVSTEISDGLMPDQWYELMNERHRLLAELSVKGEKWEGFNKEIKPKGFDVISRLKKRLYKIEGQLNKIRVGNKQELSDFYSAVSDDEKFTLIYKEINSIKSENEELLSSEYSIFREAKSNPRGLDKADRDALMEIRAERESINKKQEFLQNNPETALYYRMAVLEGYHRDLQNKGFVETPSRQALAERIKRHIENSEPILLEGETGTGKTELALNLCRRLYEQEPEFISGSPDVRASDIFAKQGLRASETAGRKKREELVREITEHIEQYKKDNPSATAMDIAQENDNYARIVAASAGITPETYLVYGPLTEAMQKGVPLVIDEANLIETRLRMILKRIYNVKPGQEVPVAGDGKILVAPGFCLIFTANLKSEKHTERFDFDEAEKRTMINSTIHVDYLSQNELYDLMLAKAMDSEGNAPLARQEAEVTLKNFCDAVADIQSAYTDRPSEMYAPKDSRGKQQEFKEGVLDPGAALRMLNGLEGRDINKSLTDFLNQSLLNYVANRNYNSKDRELILKIFLSKGFLQEASLKELELSHLDETAIKPFKDKQKSKSESVGIKELSRKQLALLDPYGLRRIAKQEIADEFLEQAGGSEMENNPDDLEISGEFSFTVKGALNPYQEALQECGVKLLKPEFTQEKIDLKVNLPELLIDDLNAYKQVNLTEWLKDIPKDIKELKLTKQQLETLKSRIEQGEIPIVMPGRVAQLKGLTEAIANLKPKWIKGNTEPQVADTYHWDYIDGLITVMQEIAEKTAKGKQLSAQDRSQLEAKLSNAKDKSEALKQLITSVSAIPEQPYIFTTKPSQQNEVRTRSITLENQLKELNKIKSENLGTNLNCLSIGEYLALQNRFTNRVFELKGQVIDAEPDELHPLDDYNRSDGTFSRFIDLPVGSGGDVPYGCWHSGCAQLELLRGDSAANSSGGFRVSVRI
jgi:MoxR-like ATPase